LADAIYAAFVDFKTEFDKKSAPPPPANNTAKNNAAPAAPATKVEEDTTEETAAETKTYAKGQKVYKVQILTEKKLLKSNNSRFKGLQNIDYYQENGVYKYTYGETADKNEAAKLMKEARKNFNGAFIITFVDGKRQK
ncbi:MAG: hypothetical protein LBN27_00005, partial [Prevotellaceae bacterium]|jgi:N-acetylmuramoyl-L-alanine amidase|nr:hypothetical protein [Prevotellaceae bacterium]